MDIEEIIINLKLLETLDKNQKLVTRGSYLNIEPRSLVPEFIRRWNRQDNRHETIKKINSVVNAAIKQLETEDVYNVREYLERSVTGIVNLKETYSTCSQTCARLDVIVDKINKSLDKVAENT
jgi:predicted transglutaminase-like cysteine proteinase